MYWVPVRLGAIEVVALSQNTAQGVRWFEPELNKQSSVSFSLTFVRVCLFRATTFLVTGERQFEDKYLFYRFREDDTTHPWLPTSEERNQAECELQECLVLLMQLAPDANLRMILRKPYV